MEHEGNSQTHNRLWRYGANGDNITNSTITHHISTHQTTNANWIDEEYGDILGDKHPEVIRIGYQNLNGIPLQHNHHKNIRLKKHLTEHKFDFFLCTEVNVCWSLVPGFQKWTNIMEGIKNKTSLSWNKTELELSTPFQPGGTATITLRDNIQHTVEQGRDETDLGRWTWTRLKGRNNHHVRMVSAYRPVSSTGPRTVCEQHQRYFNQYNEFLHPRHLFLRDLALDLEKWKSLGDSIVLGMDANEDVRSDQLQQFFAQFGMKEAIIKQHHPAAPPATYNRNTAGYPIDGIWTTDVSVIAAGYLPHGDGAQSDHRCLWIEIDRRDFYRGNLPPLVPPEIRRLKASDPRMVLKYQERLRAQLNIHQLPQKLKLIRKEALNGWNPELEHRYNAIHSSQLQIRKGIEKKIRKLRMGGHPWSPKLQNIRNEIEVWTLLQKRKKGVRVSNRRIRRILHKTSIINAYQLQLPQIKEMLDQTFKDYKAACKVADNWRDEFEYSLAHSRAIANGTDEATELKKMNRIKRQQRQAHAIKRARNKHIRNATTQVYVTHDRVRRIVTDKGDIEQTCIEENISRFTQSEDTPPMTAPLIHDLQYIPSEDVSQAILNGTYQIPEGVDDYGKKFLAQLKTNLNTETIEPWKITRQNHQHAWKRQKEKISSEPSNLSFSHFKASALSDDLADFDCDLRTVPLEQGFAPTDWKRIVDVEILKKAGVYDIEKMRTITLMEAQYNMNNKLLGKNLMHTAEELGMIAPEQFGSRKHHRSILAALNKKLTNDILRQRRKSGALCSNDAKSCYDRIVHSIAFLCLLRCGVPRPWLLCLFHVLQQAHHKIRTAYGISTFGYGDDLDPPLQGLGQGNGCAPAAWAAISSVLINMMREEKLGFESTSALSHITTALVCYAFVDDTDLIHTSSIPKASSQQVRTEMQKAVDHWEAGLRFTGGGLRADKSFWYLIGFKWEEGRWQYETIDDSPGDITIKDVSGTRVTLERLEPTEARKTLGIFLDMTGNELTQIQALKDKVIEFADDILKSSLSKRDVWHANLSTIMRTLSYPLAATSLTKKQWNSIMKPLLQVILPKTGFNRRFPHALIYAMVEHGGLGIIHLWIAQIVEQIQICLTETYADSSTGELINHTVEDLRVEAGWPGTIGDIPKELLEHATTLSWIQCLLIALSETPLRIHDDRPLLQLLRENDRFLMQVFFEHGYRKKDLYMLNMCRMWLQVITLADICDFFGTSIEKWAFDGNPRTNTRPSINWPTAPTSLPKQFWTLWKTALVKCFTNERRQLRHQLGEWFPDALEKWDWLLDPHQDRVYHNEGTEWSIWTRSSSRSLRTSTRTYRKSTLTTAETPGTTPVSIELRGTQKICITGIAHRKDPPPIPSLDIDNLLANRDPKDAWAVTKYDIIDIDPFVDAIQQGNARAVSDGSFKDGKGTSAFVMRSPSHDKHSITGVNFLRSDAQDSYRCELAGISGILTILAAVCTSKNITSGAVTIGLDGDSALQHSSAKTRLSAGSPSFDLLKDIRRKIQQLPIKVHWKWIKGHQDGRHGTLDRWAKDNILVDNMAKAYYNQIFTHQPEETHRAFLHEGWHVTHNGNKLDRTSQHFLIGLISRRTTLEYWENKFQWNHQLIETIDWDVCKDSFCSLTNAQNRRRTKIASGHVAVGKMMKLWKFWDHEECPRCSNMEDNKHIIKCPAPTAKQALAHSLDSTFSWLHRRHAPRQLIQAIRTGIDLWTRDLNPQIPRNNPFYSAFHHQSQLGWWPFLLGFISSKWRTTLEQTWNDNHKPTNLKRWTQQLVKKLIATSWDMWEHRNGILHQPDHSTHQNTLQEHLIIFREELRTGTRTLLSRDRPRLEISEKQFSEYSEKTRNQWILSVQAARDRYRHRDDASDSATENQRRILRNWLTSPQAQDRSIPDTGT